jgi:3-oxoacyl-(acyl-carrier-protein) synthase/NAD(P)-dependent dehydrogenase (short-subunit alcohol dehydrogenase family)/SAM-dependent methyltransferase
MSVPHHAVSVRREPVAVIGIGCRFPGGAETPSAFWDLLVAGRDGVREIDRWRPHHGSGLPRWGATLDGIDMFDAEFFGIPALEAARMDPQQRLLLEVAWEALEHAGQPADRLAGSRTGVFVGIYNTDYAWEQHDAGVPDDVYAGVGAGGAIAANRLSYLLDLRGPSLAVDTTCSSSLVATHLAVQSLRNGESDLALAAGVNLTLSPTIAKTVAAVIPLAVDGACKPFDRRADGIVRGEACAVVVLKRLSEAQAAGDPILAVIAGSAVGQDGRSNGFTAPNLAAQEAVIRAALADANVDAPAISYVEAHGTGTALGDPIEWEALESVLGVARTNGRCLVGSVKANVGHCEAAAGIAGLVKTVLALRHRRIPVQPHFESPNPRLVRYGQHLITPTSTIAWSGPAPRRAGVSAFSLGGTNAHVIIEEAPAEAAHVALRPASRRHVLTISARRSEALRQLVERYLELLDSGVDIHDLCYSAARRRAHLPLRITVAGVSAAELAERLREWIAAPETHGGVEEADWAALYPEGRCIALPTYAWQRERHWFHAPAAAAVAGVSASTPALAQNEPADTAAMDDGIGRYVYELAWGDADLGADPGVASSLTSCDLHGAAEVMTDALPDLMIDSGFARYRGAAPVLEACAGRAVEAALARDGWRPSEGDELSEADLRERFGVRDVYARLFGRVLDVLAEDGVLTRVAHDRWRVSRPPREVPWTDEEVREAAGEESSLLRRCTERLCDTWRGQCNPLELLFAGGMEQAERLFSESAFAKLFNGLAARAMASIIASAPATSVSAGARLRVLEIGAGTGGTTAALLPHCPEDRTAYVFTDVSASFFSRARERFARFPFVTYRTLDIESDPAAQGFEGARFDLIIAAHVLHATADVAASVRHAQSLLAPGGVLLLVESTARQRLTDFTYGLTPGWWRHTDVDLRHDHPLLPAARWLDVLRATGFDEAVCTPDAAVAAADFGAAVIIARTPAPRAEADRPVDAGRWLVIGDSRSAAACTQAIEALGGAADRIVPRDDLAAALQRTHYARVVYMAGLNRTCCEADTAAQIVDATVAAAGDLIATVQALAAHPQPAPFWLLTRGAQSPLPASAPVPAQAPLDAVGAVVAREYPAVWGGALDLDPDADADYVRVIDVLRRATPPAALALRGDRVLSRRLAPAAISTGQPTFDRHGAYLITGGFGGMGLRIADRLSAAGAGCVVLAGRRGATPDSQAIVDTITARGTAVIDAAVDVSDETAVRGLLARIDRSPFRLRGIVHAAGIFDDQLLARHDADSLRRVLLPKVAGAWNLHRLTSDRRLDHFVLFSSAAHYLSPIGLANYAAANAFVDALARYRRARGLTGVSIAWAGWTDTGMVNALPPRRIDEWARLGVRSLDPETGLDVLERLMLAGGPAHALAMDVDPQAAAVPHIRDGVPQRVAAGDGWPERLAARTAMERERLLGELVASEAARIMDTGDSPIEWPAALADIGLDSLMALELRNALATATRLDLPASFVFDYPTVAAITTRLLALLFPGAAPSLPAADDTHRQLSSLIGEVDRLSDDDAEAQLAEYARSFLHTP